MYGVVALIVKMDDLGLYWAARQNRLLQMAGRALLWFAPKLLKALSVAGTAAMFIVGGHLWVENIASLHHLAQHWTQGLDGFSAWWVDAAFLRRRGQHRWPCALCSRRSRAKTP